MMNDDKNYEKLKRLLQPYCNIPKLQKELEEDGAFNVVNRIEKIQELHQKYVKWICRLRAAQAEYNEWYYEREEIRESIGKVVEDSFDANLTKMTITKEIDKHPLWNAYNKKLSDLKFDIEWFHKAVDGINNIGFRLRDLTTMLNQEKL